MDKSWNLQTKIVHAVCVTHDTCHRVYVVKIDGSVGFAKMI